jgi:cobalt/nickel transport system permease protein
MHMADALISPAVGGAMWAATAATVVYCAKKIREESDQSKVPLMGVLGAFVFAAQMVNFSIPGTGSSGHLGGGLILAILLGPEAAFLVMASVLTVQALFFADGGLLSLGANIFNLGFLPAFVAFPLLYRWIAGSKPTTARVVTGAMLAGVVGLQLGALGVVLETTMSGVSALPLTTFLAMMLPIHLAIGVVEGLVTAGVVLFVRRAQPEILERTVARRSLEGLDLRPVVIGIVAAAVVAGGFLSWFASTNPDGLEWSIAKVTGRPAAGATGATAAHAAAAAIQKRTALLPDYGFKAAGGGVPARPGPSAATSAAGLAGAAMTLVVAGLVGWVLRRRRAASASKGTG